jgi:calcineurin-like phosphoesterase family protein
MNLYISDLHFGHKNVIKFDYRPFFDVDEMDQTLIYLWNTRVNNDDDVYIVGDFCYRNGRQEQWYLRQLKGKKHLIVGNHDDKLLKNEEALSYFESIDRIMKLKDEDKEVVLCHFPLASWEKEHYGSWHIYGHVHGNGREGDRIEAIDYMLGKEKALNAGCMINNYSPASLNELIVNNNQYWNRKSQR